MTKINEEELKTVQKNRSKVIEVTEQLTEILLQQVVLNDIVEKTKEEFLKSVSREEEYFSELNKKYDVKGLLNIETGEIETS